MKRTALLLVWGTTLLTIACQTNLSQNLGYVIQAMAGQDIAVQGVVMNAAMVRSTWLAAAVAVFSVILAGIAIFPIRKENQTLEKCWRLLLPGYVVFPVAYVLAKIFSGQAVVQAICAFLVYGSAILVIWWMFHGLDEWIVAQRIPVEHDLKPCIYFFITYFFLPTIYPFNQFGQWIQLACSLAIFYRMYFFYRAARMKENSSGKKKKS